MYYWENLIGKNNYENIVLGRGNIIENIFFQKIKNWETVIYHNVNCIITQ